MIGDKRCYVAAEMDEVLVDNMEQDLDVWIDLEDDNDDSNDAGQVSADTVTDIRPHTSRNASRAANHPSTTNSQ